MIIEHYGETSGQRPSGEGDHHHIHNWDIHNPDVVYRHRAMIELRRGLESYRSASALIRELRPDLGQLVTMISDEIQDSIPVYAGAAGGRRSKLIVDAVNAAVHHFLDLAEGTTATGSHVDAIFKKLGYGEAIDGNDLAPLRAAFGIATRAAWLRLRKFGDDLELPDSAIGPFGDGIFNYINHLDRQATGGFNEAVEAMTNDVNLARMRLLDSLINPVRYHHTAEHVNTAAWQIPDRATLLLATYGEHFPCADALSHDALVRASTNPAILVCDSREQHGLVRELQEREDIAALAVSWPVPVDELPDAFRWVRRAMTLQREGIIAEQQVIDCWQYRTQLWLHAEPRLRRDMVQEILSPLLKETPNSREILSETLLVWLERRDTAPALAAILGVHPQTVRYRWKRINDLFGESLRDPEFTTQLIMVLKASVPLWQAGDHKDFERWHERSDS